MVRRFIDRAFMFIDFTVTAVKLRRDGVPVSVIIEAFQLATYWTPFTIEECVRVIHRGRKEDLPAMDLIALMEAYEVDLPDAIAMLRDMHATTLYPMS